MLSRTIQSTVLWLPHNSGVLPTPEECHFPAHVAEVDINRRQVKRAEKSVMEDTYFLLQRDSGVAGEIKASTADSVCEHLGAHTYTLMSLHMMGMILFLLHTWAQKGESLKRYGNQGDDIQQSRMDLKAPISQMSTAHDLRKPGS